MRRYQFRTALVVVGLLAWAGVARASGVTVSPPLLNLTITQNQPQVSFDYSVTNNDSSPRTYTLSTSDFGSLNESGGVVFLGYTPGQIRQYGLANWLKLSQAQITIAPAQTEVIKGEVTNSDNLAPGGHYGAILLTQVLAANNQQLQLQPVASTLLFVDKLGGEKYGLQLNKVTRDSHWWQSLSLKLRFYDNGNIDEVPRGVVKLIDPLGHEVARGSINDGSVRILPGTYRSFIETLISERRINWPGRYQLQIQYRYDGQANFTTLNQTWWYFNLWGVLAVVAAGLVILAAVVMASRKLLKNRRKKH